MLELNFRRCKGDPSVWLREMKDKYKYIATYVDDVLIDLKNNTRSAKT